MHPIDQSPNRKVKLGFKPSLEHLNPLSVLFFAQTFFNVIVNRPRYAQQCFY
jgi:hypothetical protein